MNTKTVKRRRGAIKIEKKANQRRAKHYQRAYQEYRNRFVDLPPEGQQEENRRIFNFIVDKFIGSLEVQR